MRELSKEEKDHYIMGLLNSGKSDLTKRGKKRQRTRQAFTVDGNMVCKATFMLYFDIGRKTLANILRHMAENGPTPRIHGNSGRRPKHALTLDDVQRMVNFVSNTGETEGIYYPAAPRGNDNVPIVFLPAHSTKVDLHKKYEEMCVSANVRCLKLSAFKTVWSSCTPHIKIAKPRDDVCATCESLRKAVSASVTEDEKLASTSAFQNHIVDARKVKL